MSSVTTLSTYVYPDSKVFAAWIANSENQFLKLPSHLIFKILGYLPTNDLPVASTICKKLHNFVSSEQFVAHYWQNYDLRRDCPALKIIDEKVWEACVDLEVHGLSVSDAQPFHNLAARSFLLKVDFSQIENNDGITLLTIPKGLSLNKLVEIARHPKQIDRAVEFREDNESDIFLQHGDKVVEKTYRVAITNNFFKQSKGLAYTLQKAFAKERGWNMPQLVPIIALAVLTYISSIKFPPTCLFNNDSEPYYVSCAERVEEYGENIGIGVGRFVPGHFDIADYDEEAKTHVGVGGMVRI